jgi:hypothetical protein
MHTITLKSDDTFYDMLESMVDKLKITKSELIRRSVLNYKETLEKERLIEQVRTASFKVREESLKSTKEFDTATSDGLVNV